MKIKFKRHPQNPGLSAVGYPYSSVDIKVGKKVIGLISSPNWQTDNKWHVRFTVMKTEPDDNPNCNWKWVSLKQTFDSESEARMFIVNNSDKLEKTFAFHFADN
jgi:hypothetical protein